MTQGQHKICPRCNLPAALDVAFCASCGRQYRTQFTTHHQTPVVPPQSVPQPVQRSSAQENSIARASDQCKSCGKSFNFLTRVMYDSASGFCKNCLNRVLTDFARIFREQIFHCHTLPAQQQLSSLGAYAQSIGLLPSLAFQHIKRDSLNLIQRVFVMCKEDGVITPEEEQYLLMMQRELYLHPNEFAVIFAEMQYIKAIQQIRSGELPVVRASIILPSTEICYWDAPATHQKVLTASVRMIEGSLIVTNHKLRFVSYEGGFEFQLAKIATFKYQHPGGVNLQLTRIQGSGYYEIQNGAMLCEIMHVLLNKHHRQVIYGQPSSRSIPQEVKNAVWQRDQARCMQCNATDYLEFDHIIPFSKGGSNSVNNVQVLCRRCNLAKSNHI